MKVLYNWLKDFVDVKAPPEELRARLSMAGIAVDSIEDSPAGPVMDAELTTNRPDCLGHRGIAREVAALYRLRLKPFEVKLKEAAEKAAAATRVEINAPELCGRYTARIIRGVKVQPSPGWLRQRLEALGQTPLNNVVDVTNCVMFELDHPTHAFDLDKLAERRIVVRRASRGEKMRTLDGIERALTTEMCVIADAARAVAVGGVMGSADSEIGFATKNVLLESAWFDPLSIHRTSKALNLRTEASIRFDRGADPEAAELASRRCAELIQQLAGGEILAGVVDAYPRPAAPLKIELTRKELLRVMGADVPDKEIEAILAALGFAPQRVDHSRGTAGSLAAIWECARPSWRRDVAREIDLIEEIARHYGFDKFPARLPGAKQPAARLPHAEAEDRLRERLMALGYQEIVTIPLVDPARDEVFRPSGAVPAAIANPLAEDASVLRTSGVTNMLQALEWNLNRGQRNLRLFEIGRAYRLSGTAPVETRILTLAATGQARGKSLHEDAREFGFADLKGDLDRLAELAGGLRWEHGGPAWLHPARAARLSLPPAALSPGPLGAKDISHREIGVAGQLARRAGELFKLRQEAFLAELELDPIYTAYQLTRAAMRYRPLPRFPAVERDFSLVLADGTTFAQVREAIAALAIPELTQIEAVDLFRGGHIPAGKYSLLVRIAFQSAEATLTEAQLAVFSARIVAALAKQLGATLRTA
jgi:phenylalanyl-tRNA synthetase beta chain